MTYFLVFLLSFIFLFSVFWMVFTGLAIVAQVGADEYFQGMDGMVVITIIPITGFSTCATLIAWFANQ